MERTVNALLQRTYAKSMVMAWLSNGREHFFSSGAMLVLSVYAGSLPDGTQASYSHFCKYYRFIIALKPLACSPTWKLSHTS